ncbi:MAG: dihydropteroate synthase [Pseudomonadota bacterium]
MSERVYLRALPDVVRRPVSVSLAGGLVRFSEIAVHRRGALVEVLPVDAVRALYGEERVDALIDLPAPRAGFTFERPRIMGVVNVTPDSFSDGGLHHRAEHAIEHGLALADQGADILDIGGESTRPGAEPVSADQECDRVLPVIEGLIAAKCKVPISIDTRKASIAAAALAAGATLFNDVSALTHDPASISITAPAYCLMHAQGDPRTMQQNPSYDDVLLDIYDFLEARVEAAVAHGIDRAQILIDPGIGFGKTLEHNMALLRGLSLFHDLGCPILVGASRKRFIGTLSGVSDAGRRAPGSVAAALWAAGQGAQVLRVHDVAETVQALSVWAALQEET